MPECHTPQGSESDSCRDEHEKTPDDIDNDTVKNNPRRWPNNLRLRATLCIGVLAFLEPFASSMVAPSLEAIAEEFSITSPVEQNVSDNILIVFDV